MAYFRLMIFAVMAFVMCLFSPSVFASDSGVIKLELADAAAVGMGGAYAGEADRSSAVYYNPAGIVQIDSMEAQAGLTWVAPQIKFEARNANNGGTSEMIRDNYIFPNVFITVPVIKDKFYLGIGESTDFGGGNDWNPNSFSRYSTIKDSITDMDFRLVGAYKVTEKWSVGAGVVNDQSQFEHLMAVSNSIPGSSDAASLFKGNDSAWGFDLSTMFKINDKNQIGLDYKSPIHHKYDGALYLSNLNPASLGPLFNNQTSFNSKAIQKLTLPPSITLGYSFKPTSKWTINLDVEWTDWSQYKKQITSYPYVTPAQATALLNYDSAREWHAVWSESIGAQYAVTDKFRVRAGYEHHKSPVPECTYDTAFPDSDTNAYTMGIGYDITSRLTIDLAYIAAYEESRRVVNTVSQGLGADLSGKYTEFINIATMQLTYKF
ncbi:MAG: transporter [Candidatus Omnitrophica bacterium]|nr:transporter [Candidatus Omnitrophota bacterium]